MSARALEVPRYSNSSKPRQMRVFNNLDSVKSFLWNVISVFVRVVKSIKSVVDCMEEGEGWKDLRVS